MLRSCSILEMFQNNLFLLFRSSPALSDRIMQEVMPIALSSRRNDSVISDRAHPSYLLECDECDDRLWWNGVGKGLKWMGYGSVDIVRWLNEVSESQAVSRDLSRERESPEGEGGRERRTPPSALAMRDCGRTGGASGDGAAQCVSTDRNEENIEKQWKTVFDKCQISQWKIETCICGDCKNMVAIVKLCGTYYYDNCKIIKY